jgi:hypothetical protein
VIPELCVRTGHILNENEPWQRVLHIREKRLENLRQQLQSGDVLEMDAASAKKTGPCALCEETDCPSCGSAC